MAFSCGARSAFNLKGQNYLRSMLSRRQPQMDCSTASLFLKFCFAVRIVCYDAVLAHPFGIWFSIRLRLDILLFDPITVTVEFVGVTVCVSSLCIHPPE